MQTVGVARGACIALCCFIVGAAVAFGLTRAPAEELAALVGFVYGAPAVMQPGAPPSPRTAPPPDPHYVIYERAMQLENDDVAHAQAQLASAIDDHLEQSDVFFTTIVTILNGTNTSHVLDYDERRRLQTRCPRRDTSACIVPWVGARTRGRAGQQRHRRALCRL